MTAATTKRERELMMHALGRPKRVDGKLDWRNRFCTSPDDEEWCALVERGLVKRGGTNGGDLVSFHVTEAGKAALDG